MVDTGITALSTSYTKGNTKFRVDFTKSDGQWRSMLFIGGQRQGPIPGATSPDMNRVLLQVASYMANRYGFHGADHQNEGSASPMRARAAAAPTLENLRDHFKPQARA